MNTDLTLSEIAHLRNVSIWTVRKWIQRGHLKAIKRAGAWFVDRDDLAKFQPSKAGRPQIKRVDNV